MRTLPGLFLLVACGDPAPAESGATTTPGPDYAAALEDACERIESSFVDCFGSTYSVDIPAGWCLETYGTCNADDLALLEGMADCYESGCDGSCYVSLASLTPSCGGVPTTTTEGCDTGCG